MIIVTYCHIAFDPIFFLHHCNVDRLFALWEYVYPEYWVGQGYLNNQGAIVPFSNTPFSCASLKHSCNLRCAVGHMGRLE
jgi:hypothetical protein